MKRFLFLKFATTIFVFLIGFQTDLNQNLSKERNSYILNHVPKSTIDKTFTSIFIQNSIVFIWFIKDKIGKHGNYFFKSLSLKNPNFRVYDLPVALYNNTCVYYLKDV